MRCHCLGLVPTTLNENKWDKLTERVPGELQPLGGTSAQERLAAHCRCRLRMSGIMAPGSSWIA